MSGFNNSLAPKPEYYPKSGYNNHNSETKNHSRNTHDSNNCRFPRNDIERNKNKKTSFRNNNTEFFCYYCNKP